MSSLPGEEQQCLSSHAVSPDAHWQLPTAHCPPPSAPNAPNVSCTKDLLNAVTATPCSLAALCGLLLGRPGVSLSCTAAAAGAAGAAAEPSLLAQRLPALGLVACGITCGFFAADCVVLWRHGDELAAEMGRANTRLMWPHHLLSLIVWPYCAVYGRGGVFVLYFLSTELSSIFLNLHVLATKGDVTPNAHSAQ